jgi:hypothetical protein
VTDLVGTVMNGQRKFTTKTDSATHFVPNKGVFAKGVADGRSDAAPKPGSVTEQPAWQSKTGLVVNNLACNFCGKAKNQNRS